MSEFVISTRYANALLQTAEENNSFEEALKSIELVYNTLASSDELKSILNSYLISTSKKENILEAIFFGKVSSEVKNFLKLIAIRGRANLLFEICERFIQLSDEKLNRIKVQISSAVELSENQKEDIVKKLEKITNKKIVASYKVDKSIIGGFTARYKDTVIDASVKHQLELLKKKLFEEKYLSN